MKKKISCSIIILITLFVFACENTSVDPEEKLEPTQNDGLTSEYITELNKIIHKLESADPSSDMSDLEILKNYGSSKIVGLGEATHGSKEFFQLKHKIFRYLVENHGFKIFAFECDMGESFYINNYITKGEGTLYNIMNEKMHFWTWRTKEVAELLLWMKDFNSTRSDGDKIHLIGVDCQALSFQPELIKEYFSSVEISKKSSVLELFDVFKDVYKNDRNEFVKKMILEKFNELKNTILRAEEEFESNKTVLISNSSIFQYNYHLQLLKNLLQVFDVITDNTYNHRDKYMAENTIWCTQQFGGSKVAAWAHNGHVAKDVNYNTGSQGYHLFRHFGTDYKVIGFSFSKGYFTAVSYADGNYSGLTTQSLFTSPKENSINEQLYNVQYDNFILDFNEIESGSKLYNYFKDERDFLMIGAVYNNVPENYYRSTKLSVLYDCIINYDITSAAEQY